jgi:hypothetical protein
MKKLFLAVLVASLVSLAGMACDNVNLQADGNNLTGTFGQPDPVFIDDFCGVSLEFGSTYVKANDDWAWNVIYVLNSNSRGAHILMKDGDRPVFESWPGYNANSCVNVMGEDGYYHTGCPSGLPLLDINTHITLYVSYWDENNQEIQCPRNGAVFDLDP